MAQVTLYLDEGTSRLAKDAAKAAGLSLSRWLAGLVREKTASQWPAEVREIAGAWPDFPETAALRHGDDVEREPL